MKHTKTSLAIAAILAAGTQFAAAIPTLFLDDGLGNTITLTDLNLDGVVSYNGAVGPTWFVNVSTGLTDPALPGPYPHMDLNSVNVSNGAGTLIIRWSDTDFGPSPWNSMTTRIGGTVNSLGNPAGSSLDYSLWGDGLNNALATTTFLDSQGPFGPGAFSGTSTGGVLGALGSPYSITQQVIIRHTAAGATSFDAETQVPDGGTTLALLGGSLLGLGAIRRKLVKA